MTSKMTKEAFVWIWLPGNVEPIVAGRVESDAVGHIRFNYGKSYLDRLTAGKVAIPIYEPELPLKSGALPLLESLSMPGAIRDAAPDAWGRRVIINRILGRKGKHVDTIELSELTYMLESGSDRIGALDFQSSPTEYIPRQAYNAPMEELIESVGRVEKGIPLSPELDKALFHGSSIGGARPKALMVEHHKKYIAKFSSHTDLYSVVKAEFIAMRLAAAVGLRVAPVTLKTSAGKDILLIERFDRVPHGDDWRRRLMVSALTILQLEDIAARYASYETLAEIIRHRFAEPKATLRELFSRLVFNILCGNTDDHARNHAAFWDGQLLSLTPAYDICPQNRSGHEASQAMLIYGNNNLSQLKTCLQACHHFLLSERDARDIFEHQISTIEAQWAGVCHEADLTEVDRRLLWRRCFLNPFSVII